MFDSKTLILGLQQNIMQAKNSDVEEVCVEGEGKAEVCFEDEEESASSKVRALCNHPPPCMHT